MATASPENHIQTLPVKHLCIYHDIGKSLKPSEESTSFVHMVDDNYAYGWVMAYFWGPLVLYAGQR